MLLDWIVALMLSLPPGNMPARGEHQCWKITQEVRVHREIIGAPSALGDRIVITRLQKWSPIPCRQESQRG